jgi:hypothetical protein
MDYSTSHRAAIRLSLKQESQPEGRQGRFSAVRDAPPTPQRLAILSARIPLPNGGLKRPTVPCSVAYGRLSCFPASFRRVPRVILMSSDQAARMMERIRSLPGRKSCCLLQFYPRRDGNRQDDHPSNDLPFPVRRRLTVGEDIVEWILLSCYSVNDIPPSAEHHGLNGFPDRSVRDGESSSPPRGVRPL